MGGIQCVHTLIVTSATALPRVIRSAMHKLPMWTYMDSIVLAHFKGEMWSSRCQGTMRDSNLIHLRQLLMWNRMGSSVPPIVVPATFIWAGSNISRLQCGAKTGSGLAQRLHLSLHLLVVEQSEWNVSMRIDDTSCGRLSRASSGIEQAYNRPM